MKNSSRGLRIIGIVFGVLVLAIVAGIVAFNIYTSNYYSSDRAVIDKIEKQYSDSVDSFSNDKGSVFLPEDMNPKAVIVFYPGGKVEYSAYNGLMYMLAARGYICLLPKMPENLAFLDIRAVESMSRNRQEDIERVRNLEWYLAGHSLGGVAACRYLNESSGSDIFNFDGIILCASYTTSDFSDTDLRFLSIYGDRDKVLNMDSYDRSRNFWPTDAKEVVIDGGIHSYFGSYGIQNGDGEPELTNEEQLQETVDVIDSWISEY